MHGIGLAVVAERFLMPVILHELESCVEFEVRGIAESASEGLGLLNDLQTHVAVVALTHRERRKRPTRAAEFIECAKRQRPGVRILSLQREAAATPAQLAMDAGADGCCLFPADGATLRKAIGVIAGGATWLDREIAAALFHHAEAPDRTSAPNRLSPRELEILRLLVTGLTNEQIARTLGRSYPTVRTHLANLYRKIGVNDRVSAAVYAIRNELK